jgi:hypothetical protein
LTRHGRPCCATRCIVCSVCSNTPGLRRGCAKAGRRDSPGLRAGRSADRRARLALPVSAHNFPPTPSASLWARLRTPLQPAIVKLVSTHVEALLLSWRSQNVLQATRPDPGRLFL